MEDINILSKSELKKARHKLEIPLYILCAFINFFIIAVIICVGIIMLVNNESDREFLELMNKDTGGINTIVYIIISVPALIGALYYQYAKTRAYAVLVSEKNFPEIYHKSVEFSQKLGLKAVPRVYIAQENGVLNAFASSIIGRGYIQLNAEIVDVAYMEHKDFNTVFYILGHEFGHVYYKHTRPSYILKILFTRLIPILGSTLSRAKEYSCDRISQLLNESDCVKEIMLLTVGRHIYKYVDAEAYLSDAKKEKGLFLWITNLMASHPISLKRIAAIADPKRKSGKLF